MTTTAIGLGVYTGRGGKQQNEEVERAGREGREEKGRLVFIPVYRVWEPNGRVHP